MIKRKEKILISALELLQEGGYSNVTTKNLARKEGVSEPALYRQYKSKREIYLAMINEFKAYDDRILDTIEDQELKGREAVIYFVSRYGELYQSYTELTTVLYSLDLYFYDQETKQLMKDILDTRENRLSKQLVKYPVEGSSFKMQYLASMINDMIITEVFKWRLSTESYPLTDSLVDKVSSLLEC